MYDILLNISLYFFIIIELCDFQNVSAAPKHIGFNLKKLVRKTSKKDLNHKACTLGVCYNGFRMHCHYSRFPFDKGVIRIPAQPQPPRHSSNNRSPQQSKHSQITRILKLSATTTSANQPCKPQMLPINGNNYTITLTS